MIFFNGTENNRLVYGMFIHMYHTVLIFTWISRRYLQRTLNAENITQSTTTALGYWSFQKTTMAEFQFEAIGLQNGLACKSIYISLSTNYCLLVRKGMGKRNIYRFSHGSLPFQKGLCSIEKSNRHQLRIGASRLR